MELTDELKKSIKEDIGKGLSPKQICTKYHISPAQYGEVKNSMLSHGTHEHITEKSDWATVSSSDNKEEKIYNQPMERRPASIERHKHNQNVSFLGLVFFALFVLTLFLIIYRKATGPALGLGIFMALAFGFLSLIFFMMEA